MLGPRSSIEPPAGALFHFTRSGNPATSAVFNFTNLDARRIDNDVRNEFPLEFRSSHTHHVIRLTRDDDVLPAFVGDARLRQLYQFG